MAGWGSKEPLVGWAANKSGDTASSTAVVGVQASHSLQLDVRTEMWTNQILAAHPDVSFAICPASFTNRGEACSATWIAGDKTIGLLEIGLIWVKPEYQSSKIEKVRCGCRYTGVHPLRYHAKIRALAVILHDPCVHYPCDSVRKK